MYHVHIWQPAIVLGHSVMQCAVCGLTQSASQLQNPDYNSGIDYNKMFGNPFSKIVDNPWA